MQLQNELTDVQMHITEGFPGGITQEVLGEITQFYGTPGGISNGGPERILKEFRKVSVLFSVVRMKHERYGYSSE